MKHAVFRFLSTRKIFRRIFPYGLLVCILLVEMYAAYYHQRKILEDRFCFLSLITLFFSLHLLKVRIHGWKRVVSLLFLWLIGLILTVHTAFLFGNGGGFTLENSIHILQPGMIVEYMKMCPSDAFLLLLFVAVFPWIIMLSGFLLYWSLRPLPRKWYVKMTGGIFAAGSIIVFFYCFHPAYEAQELVNAYHYTFDNRTVNYTAGVKFSPVNADEVKALPGKNLVFIILESTEKAYLDEKVFPGLVPNLKKISRESQLFTNIYMACTAYGTYGALSSMFLGTYLTIKYASRGYILENYIGNQLSSFPRILHKAGYRQYFLMGCSGNFADTRQLVKDHDFDVAWFGVEHLKRNKHWELSVRDSAVFEQAWKYFQQAMSEKKPFNITLLTMDAHGPNGFYDRKGPRYPGKDKLPLFDAMYASDYALGRFLDRIRSSPAAKNTCIVITSDHLAHFFTNTGNRLSVYPDRKMLFMIWNSSVPTFKADVSGLTFDEAPTILDAIGVKHNYTFPLGESLYSPSPDPERLKSTMKQEAVLNTYIALKSRPPVKLPQEITVAEQPYPMLTIDKFRISLRLEDHVQELPDPDEIFIYKIPDDRIIRQPEILYFKRFYAGVSCMKRVENCIFIVGNGPNSARFFKVPKKKGYILGMCNKGRTMLKTAEKADALKFSREEVRKLLR